MNAAKIAVWAQPSPPEWLVPLHQLRKEPVESTLIPWIVQEAKSLQKGAGSRRTLSMALNCPPVVRSSLLRPLLEMISTLRARESKTAGVQSNAEVRRESPTMQLQWSIAKLLVSRPGLASHSALKAILAAEMDHSRRWSISGLVIQHAESVAQASALWSAERLTQICSPFASQPRTERQLYEQVCARLQEIQTMVEEGPFSERDLFAPRMQEKFLQRWLAAKLWDTQQRRFSVHREEELDDDKMPDIQLSCAAGNVCLEVKPLDSSRSYSANSLVTDTLERQLVGQYLKGMNSGHGILVLLQLDNKQWEVPGQTGLHHFSKLIDYLHAETQRIKHQHPTVAELAVLGTWKRSSKLHLPYLQWTAPIPPNVGHGWTE